MQGPTNAHAEGSSAPSSSPNSVTLPSTVGGAIGGALVTLLVVGLLIGAFVMIAKRPRKETRDISFKNALYDEGKSACLLIAESVMGILACYGIGANACVMVHVN